MMMMVLKTSLTWDGSGRVLWVRPSKHKDGNFHEEDKDDSDDFENIATCTSPWESSQSLCS